MDNIKPIAELMSIDDRRKAKEIASKVIKKGDDEGLRFGDVLQEELDKLKSSNS